jgi:hypothetical protein
MFDHLMDEVACINRAYGWVGCFDAIKYIYENRDEYAGTKVYREIGIFMRQGAQLFKESDDE